MSVTFQVEPWQLYYRDCQELWKAHYSEIAVRKDQMAMKPDVAAYQALEASGALSIIVGRGPAGRMVGYILSVVRPHLHYADVLCGFEDAYFLAREERRGRTGIALLRAWEAEMRRRGCKLIFAMTKTEPRLDMSKLFGRLGFNQTDAVMAKWIGD